MTGGRSPRIILLCAAPGTQLSGITKGLEAVEPAGATDDEEAVEPAVQDKGESPSTKTWDLESFICGSYDEAGAEQAEAGTGPKHTMAEVVHRPRQEQYQRWSEQFNRILREIHEYEEEVAAQAEDQDATDVTTHVICMHLTWYNSPWKEFYSPVDITVMANPVTPISHIVILIDDIYDMFRRLERPGALYDDENIGDKARMAEKLSKPPPESPDGTPDTQAGDFQGQKVRTNPLPDSDILATRYRAEAVELSLGELLGWRRAEMIYAESIARNLVCPLTVLATKHTQEALRLLAERPDAPRIYLSHRISDLRRAVAASGPYAHPDLASWEPIAGEVHELHNRLVSGNDKDEVLADEEGERGNRGQLLINPTAIDELRFETDPTTLRRVPRLTPRWPLPDNKTLYEGPGEEAPHHLDIIPGKLPPDDVVASHAARSLSIHIASEVSFRDHFIVENTPSLCVYRPFYCAENAMPPSDPDWSGGVAEELTHWLTYMPALDAGQRRIAFVHAHSEIRARLLHITGASGGNPAATDYKGNIVKMVGHLIPQFPLPRDRSDELDSVLGNTDGEKTVLANLNASYKAFAAAPLAACHFAFSNVERRTPSSYLLVHAADDLANGKLKEMGKITEQLRAFFADDMGEDQVTALNKEFFTECDNIFRASRQMSLARHALGLAGVDTQRVRDRLRLP